ncbi:AraC family transcriptional regulator [Muricauda sp. MAR_2010_75]|jgi:AraC-like DNA-binding protein|uniref:helix-turn-helix domain-containing protein n=1 Tax=Allomuricauda sp. MAR_2010_75 TaxID=1250232 RepID=UPI00056D0F7D|nr:AraC family transcriptional regulator [Muricauda sp. MAR_2010_75]
MLTYKNHITRITDDIYDFPYKYGNEIYHSKIARPEYTPVEYESNFSIKFMFRGAEKYIVNGDEKKVTAGKMLIVNDKSHVINRAESSEAFSVFLTQHIIKDCKQNLMTSADYLLDEPFDQSEESINFYDHVSNRNIPALELLRSRIMVNPDIIIPAEYYFELAHDLLVSQKVIQDQINRVDRLKFSTRKEIYRRVSLTMDYLMSNIHEKFSLDSLAKASCMSKYQLIRSFKEVYGITPNRYFILEKMKQAKNELQYQKECSIKETAFKFGYPSLASFSKQFKQVFGIYPSRLE